jgi:hypothetical protein
MASLALYVLHKSNWILRINIYRDTYIYADQKFGLPRNTNVKNKDGEGVFYYVGRWK